MKTAAQAVYGRQLSIPGCVLDSEYNLGQIPQPKRYFIRNQTHTPASLASCSHVWLRKPGVLPSLTRPYVGPFAIISRNLENNTCVIDLNGVHETVNLERVKPYRGLEDMHTHTDIPNKQPALRHVTFDLSAAH